VDLAAAILVVAAAEEVGNMKKILSIQEMQSSRWPELLQKTFGDNLVSAFIHGNCLMEGYDPFQSPWTVSLILKNNGPEVISKIKKEITLAILENVKFLYFFSPNEILTSLDAFPLEYLHIAYKNEVLCGIQPLAGFSPNREELRLECERELRGILMHLRVAFAYAKAGKNTVELHKEILNQVLPILYGVHFLEHGVYPDCHQKIFDQYPALAECQMEKFIKTLDEIINKVDSMEEK